jgi:hypothetical protein
MQQCDQKELPLHALPANEYALNSLDIYSRKGIQPRQPHWAFLFYYCLELSCGFEKVYIQLQPQSGELGMAMHSLCRKVLGQLRI